MAGMGEAVCPLACWVGVAVPRFALVCAEAGVDGAVVVCSGCVCGVPQPWSVLVCCRVLQPETTRLITRAQAKPPRRFGLTKVIRAFYRLGARKPSFSWRRAAKEARPSVRRKGLVCRSKPMVLGKVQPPAARI